METRELYRQKYEAQIREWGAKIDVMAARMDKLTAEGKLEAKPVLDGLHAKLDAARGKLHEIGRATDDTWDEVKEGAEHAWHEVKAAFEGAHDALMPKK